VAGAALILSLSDDERPGSSLPRTNAPTKATAELAEPAQKTANSAEDAERGETWSDLYYSVVVIVLSTKSPNRPINGSGATRSPLECRFEIRT